MASHHRARALAALLVVVCGLGACGEPSPPSRSAVAAAIVYGADDRQEVYAHPEPALRAAAQRSVVALVATADIDETDPANVRFTAQALGPREALCAGERFVEQPTAAFCSGTLIDDDLVLTEGHCLPRAADCTDTRLVFGYYYDAPGALHRVTREDVFRCAQVLVRRDGAFGAQVLDYAVIRLDRAAAPRFAPVAVRRATTPLAAGTALAVIGFGSGVPAKIDTGVRVLDPRAAALDYFLASSDTFPGNSGSPALEADGRVLVGTLMGGEGDDYVQRGDCWVVNPCDAPRCPGEQLNYVHHAVQALCAAGSASRLCRPSQCGDAFCDADEAPATCAADCAASGADGGTSAPDASSADGGDGGGVAPADALVADASARDDAPGAPAGCGCAAPGIGRGSAGRSVLVALAALLALARRRAST